MPLASNSPTFRERSPEGERALIVGQLRQGPMLELAFLLEIIGPGQTEAAGRRTRALNMAYSMQRDRAAFRETIWATNFIVCRGFGRVT